MPYSHKRFFLLLSSFHAWKKSRQRGLRTLLIVTVIEFQRWNLNSRICIPGPVGCFFLTCTRPRAQHRTVLSIWWKVNKAVGHRAIDGSCWQVAFSHARARSHHFLLSGMFAPLDLSLAYMSMCWLRAISGSREASDSGIMLCHHIVNFRCGIPSAKTQRVLCC